MNEYTVCECCALLIANGDDSSCRDYYGHTHLSCDLPASVFLGSEDSVEVSFGWSCDGCGSLQLPFSRQFDAIILN